LHLVPTIAGPAEAVAQRAGHRFDANPPSNIAIPDGSENIVLRGISQRKPARATRDPYCRNFSFDLGSQRNLCNRLQQIRQCNRPEAGEQNAAGARPYASDIQTGARRRSYGDHIVGKRR
jgi:hypothetical protein